MEKKVIVLDEKNYESKQDVLLDIKEKLNFPYYAGINLDALNDCISDIFYPVTFVIIPQKEDGLSDWMHEIFTVLTEISEHSNTLKIICSTTQRESENDMQPCRD